MPTNQIVVRYNAANMDQLIDRINRYSIGMDDIFDRLGIARTTSNYPPYNLFKSVTQSRLEMAAI